MIDISIVDIIGVIIGSVAALSTAITKLYDYIRRQVRIVDVGLYGPWKKESKERNEILVYELYFKVRAPRGAIVQGEYVIIPRIKQGGKWKDYAPLKSPKLKLISEITFAPLYIETDLKNYIYVYGDSEYPTSAIALLNEPFELKFDINIDDDKYRGASKKIKLQKLLRKYNNKNPIKLRG